MKAFVRLFIVAAIAWASGCLSAPALADPAAAEHPSSADQAAPAGNTYGAGDGGFHSVAARLDDIANVKDYGARGDGSTDDCNAFTAAIATRKVVYVPKSSSGYKIACQLTLAAPGQEIVCAGRVVELQLYYASGPQIVIGGSASLSQNIAVRSCRLTSEQSGQAMFFTRWVRGFRLIDVVATADQLLKLGDSTLGPAKPTYIVESYGGSELQRVPRPTMHYVNAENFAGQWVCDHCFYEGGLTPGLSGFRVADNIQSKVDDLQWIDGYWSRDDVNIDLTDGRVVNLKIANLQSEGGLTNALKLAVTSSRVKSKTQVGAEGVVVIGGRWDAGGAAILIQHDRNEDGVEAISNITLIGVQITGADGTKTPIVVESLTPASVVREINIQGVNGDFKPSDAHQDFVRLTGVAGSDALSNVSVDGITASSRNAIPLRSVLRIEGAGNRLVGHGGLILGRNTRVRVDDQSGVALRNGWIYKSATQDFGPIAAGRGASTTVAVGGAAVGDYVAGEVTSAPLTGVHFDYQITQAGTVTITAENSTAAALTAARVAFLLRIKPADL